MPDRVTADRTWTREPAAKPLLRTMLGRVLRRTRQEQGRTLAEVAHAARVSMPYLSELERGRKEASSEVLAAICDALATDLPDLLAEVGRGLAAGPASAPPHQHIAPTQQNSTPPRRAGRPGPEVRASAGAAGPARHGTVVQLDEFRGRRHRIPRARRAPGAGEVVLLRAA